VAQAQAAARTRAAAFFLRQSGNNDRIAAALAGEPTAFGHAGGNSLSEHDSHATLPEDAQPQPQAAELPAQPEIVRGGDEPAVAAPLAPRPQARVSARAATWLTRLALALILALALALRLYGVNWDDGQHAHPDERWISMVASDLEWPASLSEALDPRTSPLNPLWSFRDDSPRSFAYGHLPLYLITGVAALLEKLAPLSPLLSGLQRATDYDHINLVGRVLSALADLGVIWLVYLIGKRFYGRGAGLLAAALVALTVSHIQLAHYAAFDTFATFFVVLTLYGALRLWERGGWQDVLLAGAAAGMAISSKFSAAPIMAAVGAACLARALGGGEAQTQGAPTWRSRFPLHGARLAVAIRLFALCCLLAAILFALTSPYALLDVKRFVLQIGEQGAMVRGLSDLPYTRQYRPTTPYVYHIEQQLRWGMGWPLGLAAFAGLGYFAIRSLRPRFRWSDLILLAWAAPYFLINGSFMVKFMRYMLPLLPILSLMGAVWLLDVKSWLASAALRLGRRRLRLARVGDVLIAVVLAASLAWSLAFVSIYGRTHSWIAASRWIYANIPDGSVLAVEHWDDNLPKSLPERGMSVGERGYRHVELPMYEPDTRAKFDNIRRVLREADYILISTNRLYRTIPRLPERYPVSTEYYRLLFAGELGFEPIQVFSSYPRLGGWEVVDDEADESFTVYDHPKAIVFAKVRDLSDAEFEALLAEAFAITPRTDGYSAPPREQEPAETPKTLLLEQPVESLPVVRGIGWNTLANRYTAVAVLFWWLVLLAIGLAATPLAWVVFRNLHDRGYALAKALGLLCVGLVTWWLASLRLLPNAWYTMLLALVALGGLSYTLWRRHRADMASWLRGQWRSVLFTEALFAGAFLAFVAIRILNPDLWQPWFGGEKSMELAFLNAILRSSHLPPYDPYYAGGTMNYYYYGQYLVSVLIKLAGVRPTIGFNLAIPTLFAMTVTNAFSIGYNLAQGVGRKAAGLVSAIAVAVMGNLTAPVQLLSGWAQVGAREVAPSKIPGLTALKQLGAGLWSVIRGEAEMPAFDYWTRATRVIPNTINEFPYFSFLFADLHPHMIAMPFAILALAFALNIVLGVRQEPGRGPDSIRGVLLRFLLFPVALGALGPINTWDLPTYLGLTALALLYTSWRLHGRVRLLATAFRFAVIAALSLAFYAPFYRHYQAISVGVGLVQERSPLGPFLMIWGFFLLVGVAYLVMALARQRGRLGILRYARLVIRQMAYLPHLLDLHAGLVRRSLPLYTLARYGLWLTLALSLLLAALGQWTLALLLPVAALAALLLLRDDVEPAEFFTQLVLFTGVLVLLGCEIVYMKDFLGGGDWRRMNTLFKFYIQVWVLLGVALGPLLPRVWRWVRDTRPRALSWAWRVACGFLLLSGLAYPALATPARVQERFPAGSPPIGTLDGMAYMAVGVYTWPDENHPIDLSFDYAAIRWLWDSVEGTPVIAEGRIDYYRENGMRVSSYTGLPTLLGAHQGEQRYDWQVGTRDGLARSFYATTEIGRAQGIAAELGIRYVYVGQLERYVYPEAGLSKFDQMVELGLLEVAYENEKVRIYRFPA